LTDRLVIQSRDLCVSRHGWQIPSAEVIEDID
jgi:hypothetical protein